MSLDAEKICEFCGENINGFGHAPGCEFGTCEQCGEPHVSHERTERDRVCPECRFAHLELDDAAPAGQGETPQ